MLFRSQQGVTLRNVARITGIEMRVVRLQENPESDLRISDLMLWQKVLEVPIQELLVEGNGQLSGPVLERSRILKLMKTATAIKEHTIGTTAEQYVNMLIGQILEIMPELSDVKPWTINSHRRSIDDLGGRILPDAIFQKQI